MRVALYARVSTEEQSLHGLSIEAQLAALREWAAGQTVVGEYVDAGISARISIKKRPELSRLLRDVEAGKVDLVAFTKLDRWTRNIREYYKAEDVLDAHGVAWKALHEDYETQTAAGRLKTNIMLAVAQDEADRTSERVKAVFAEKRRKGLAVNGRTPFGLDYDEGKVKPNADAEKVTALFRYFIAERNVTALAARSPDILGRPYTPRGIKTLLQNEKYVAAGIVPPETFRNVQNILQNRATRRGSTKRTYLFSGLLACPVCGYRLTVHTRVWKDVPYVYYRCDRSDKLGRCSWHGSVRETELEDYLRRHLLTAVAQRNLRITKAAKKPVNVESLQKKLDRLTDLYVEGSIDKADFDLRAAPLRDAIKTARLTPHEADTDEIRAALDVYTSLSKAAQKAFWSALIKRITPKDDGYDLDLVLL